MRITIRTVFILLLVTILIMAYCGTTADAKSIASKIRGKLHPSRKPVVYKRKTKQKIKITTKVRHRPHKQSLAKKIKNRIRGSG